MCAIIVGVAATNTANNALYIVLAALLSILVVSGVVSHFNLKRLAFELVAPEEVFAKLPFYLRMSIENRSRILPRWLVVIALTDHGQPLLIPYLPRAGTSRGYMEMILSQRGRHRFSWVHVGSIFPVGFFHKGLRYVTDVEVLVYPELFPAGTMPPVQSGEWGEGMYLKAGWGYDLHSLRAFRPGDDPRGIHWKQTARTGNLIFTEREAEEGARLSIVFDNAVGELESDAEVQRFERLVSEAATAAVDYLGRGYSVELLTREVHLKCGSGPLHRRMVLEALALVEARPRERAPLVVTAKGPQLRLGMEAMETEGAA